MFWTLLVDLDVEGLIVFCFLFWRRVTSAFFSGWDVEAYVHVVS